MLSFPLNYMIPSSSRHFAVGGPPRGTRIHEVTRSRELPMPPLAQQGLNADINVTPMIDVLLVLLVVFILSMQLRSVFDVNVPRPMPKARAGAPSPHVVLELRADVR